MKRLYIIEAKYPSGWLPQTHLEPSISLVVAKKRLSNQQKKVPNYEFRIAIYVFDGDLD